MRRCDTFKYMIIDDLVEPFIGHFVMHGRLFLYFGEVIHDKERNREFILSKLHDRFLFTFNDDIHYMIYDYGISISLNDDHISIYDSLMKGKKISYTINGLIVTNEVKNLTSYNSLQCQLFTGCFNTIGMIQIPFRERIKTPNIFFLKDTGYYESHRRSFERRLYCASL